jgi:hypothetical protein
MDTKSVNEVFEKAQRELLKINKNSDSEIENKILKRRLNMLSIIMNYLLDDHTRNKIYNFLNHTENINDETKNYFSLGGLSSSNVCLSDKKLGHKE